MSEAVSSEVLELREETRVRMNCKQGAKGGVQLDITAEAPTVEKARELLAGAIDALTETVAEKGLALVQA